MEEINRGNEITCLRPSISFLSYDKYMNEARRIAEYINSIELTGDNIQEAKKVLAYARKLTGALDTRRKEIKAEIMEPYKVLEAQVKDINGIIDEADARLRAEIRAIEDQERDLKEEQLRGIWAKRIGQYSFTRYIDDAFDIWLDPKHLNKSTSMKSAEEDMTRFMEDTEHDIEVILAMPDAEEVMIEYAGTLNLADAIAAVQRQREYREQVFDGTEKATFIIEGKANITLVEMLLKQNEIKYTRR